MPREVAIHVGVLGFDSVIVNEELKIDLLHVEEVLGDLGRHVVGAHTHLTECLQSFRPAYVFGWPYLFEVARPIVEYVAVKVVNLHAGNARPYPCLVDEDMAVLIAEIAHLWIVTASFAVMAMPTGCLHGRWKAVLHLTDRTPRDGEEPSVGCAIELHVSVPRCVTSP